MTGLILVAGATGTQGGAVARELLAHGHPVRALTRDPGKEAAKGLAALGAEVVPGDFDEPSSLRRAARGTSAMFAMSTPYEAGPAAETRQCVALIDAAKESGTGHIVYSSVASAMDGTGIPHFESKAEVERQLAKAGARWTVLAPVAFLENIFAPWVVAQGLAEGRYEFPMPGDIPRQQLAIADLAAFVRLALEQPDRFAGQRIELASVEATGQELTSALSRWLGREITYAETPLNHDDQDSNAMIKFFRRGGYGVDIPALRSAYPEIRWHDLETWAGERHWPPSIAR